MIIVLDVLNKEFYPLGTDENKIGDKNLKVKGLSFNFFPVTKFPININKVMELRI